MGRGDAAPVVEDVAVKFFRDALKRGENGGTFAIMSGPRRVARFEPPANEVAAQLSTPALG